MANPDILSVLDTLQPVSQIRGDLRKIADVHILFYKFYIRFASRCHALVFDKKSRDYLESCVHFLENKKLSNKAIQQSRSNCLKMLDSLNDLCISLGGDKGMFSTLHKVIEQAVVEEPEAEKGEGGTLDLLKQLKNLLNDPVEEDAGSDPEPMDTGRVSPANSSSSSAPEPETSKPGDGIEPMMQYLLSDSGMDGHYHKYGKEVKNVALTHAMNTIMTKAAALRDNSFCALNSGISKLKINVPIWNYNLDRVDSINSSNVMEYVEIFRGNQSVTDAVLYSCPELLTVGPFDVYLRNKVFVYHCMVNNCNDCMTTSIEYLNLHVKYNHGDCFDGDWTCASCELIELHSIGQKSLDGALDHLAKYHSSKSTYALSNERLLEINKKIVKDDETSICPEVSGEIQTEDNINLYHCPVVECDFSTNCPSVAFGHYASIPDQQMTFKCRYCPLESFSTYELCDHLVKKHGNARYKCGYCPYRTVSKTNAVFHQRDIHGGLPNKIFGFEPLPNAVYEYTCQAHNTIKPFVCPGCNFSSLVERKFNSHLLSHPGTMVKCHYCQRYETDDISDLRDHLLLHDIGEYHCLYCEQAFNFIARIERHLHEEHPSQYPFIIICQDYDARSLSLKGKYNKIQKLDIGQDSIIVLPIDSDVSICRVEIISKSESILIDDVDHSKIQLKTFLKNKEEPVEPPPVIQLPRIEETLDLTGTDERERADIKPRIRVKTTEQLEKEAREAPRTEIDESISGLEVAPVAGQEDPPAVAPVEDQSSLLTPAQIKKEMVAGNTSEAEQESLESDIVDIDMTDTVLIPSVQIKREVEASKATSVKSPKKKPPAPPAERLSIKQEIPENAESRELATRQEVTENQTGMVWESNEDNDAAAVIAQQAEAERLASPSARPGEGSKKVKKKSESASMPVLVKILGLVPDPGETRRAPEVECKAPSADLVSRVPKAGSMGPRTKKIVVKASSSRTGTPLTARKGQTSQPRLEMVEKEKVHCDVPILSESSIDNIPVDFDCEMSQQVVDTKEFAVDDDGNIILKPMLYKEPRIVDTVIISDGEDEYDEMNSPRTSSVQGSPRVSQSQSMRPQLPALTAGPSSFKANNACLSTSGPGSAIPGSSAQIDPTSSTPPTKSDTKKYRCKLCNYTSEHREVTYEHLYAEHPESLNSRVRRRTTATVPGDVLVDAVSCPYCPDKVYEGIKSFERHHCTTHGDFSEMKCFFVYSAQSKQQPQQVFACNFCGHFCRNEDSIWEHTYKGHSTRINGLKRPLQLKSIVALKKMVCPLYNCLDEFLDPVLFKEHIDSHQTVIACKICTYIADTVEAFQAYHDELDPVERLTHFFYQKSKEDRDNLVHVQRFSNPLYSLNHVLFKEKVPASVKKTTARKSTGGAQYVHH